MHLHEIRLARVNCEAVDFNQHVAHAACSRVVTVWPWNMQSGSIMGSVEQHRRHQRHSDANVISFFLPYAHFVRTERWRASKFEEQIITGRAEISTIKCASEPKTNIRTGDVDKSSNRFHLKMSASLIARINVVELLQVIQWSLHGEQKTITCWRRRHEKQQTQPPP